MQDDGGNRHFHSHKWPGILGIKPVAGRKMTLNLRICHRDSQIRHANMQICLPNLEILHPNLKIRLRDIRICCPISGI
jgi:hypothetical protein